MNAVFDTLTAARNMHEAGLECEAAEAVATAIQAGQGDLATKADLAALKTDMAALKTELKADMAALEARMQANLWRALLLQSFAIVGAVVALMKLLP